MATEPQKLRDFVTGSGLSFKENGRSFIFDCPKCGGSDKVGVLKTNGYFKCWVCAETENYKGRPEILFSDMLVVPIRVVREQLYGLQPVSTLDPLEFGIADFFGPEDEVDVGGGELVTQVFPWHYHPIDQTLGAKGKAYMAGRGIPVEVATEYGLRYSPVERRVAFPVYAGEQLVGWQARSVGQTRFWSEEEQKFIEVAKILSSDDIPRDRTLMFSNRVVGQHAVLCEGPIDAMKAHLCGGNVAAMGKAISRGQINLLRGRGVERVYLALDPDAFAETSRLVRDMSDMEVYYMDPRTVGDGKDLGDLSFDKVLELFRSARRVGPGSLFVYFGR